MAFILDQVTDNLWWFVGILLFIVCVGYLICDWFNSRVLNTSLLGRKIIALVNAGENKETTHIGAAGSLFMYPTNLYAFGELSIHSPPEFYCLRVSIVGKEIQAMLNTADTREITKLCNKIKEKKSPSLPWQQTVDALIKKNVPEDVQAQLFKES